MADRSILSLRGITKNYPGVQALNSINLELYRGEIHALVGENGAGKSTLIKIITGAVKTDEGEILIDNHSYTSYSPHDALFELGIAAIYQEFNLVSSLSVSDNIFLGKELKRGMFLDYSTMNNEAAELLAVMGFSINPKTPVNTLSVAEQQIVEIGKALSHDVKLLIMDEPTAPLTPKEVGRLFKLVENLKKQEVTIIYISHRLDEALSISDRITVLRDGELIKTMSTRETNRKELIGLMVGRNFGQEYQKRKNGQGDVILEVEDLSTESVTDINFVLHSGEILGIAGLVGSGRTEIARALIGIDTVKDGIIKVHGHPVEIHNPTVAKRLKIGLIPEDRKKQGILGKMSVKHNISFTIADEISRCTLINEKKEKQIVKEFIDRLNIKTPNQAQLVQHLSGGNQQKVVLSKWLASDCSILIFDEPTRGVDVGAKQEIYYIMDELAKSGKGIIMISSDLPELIRMADRILVMNSGKVQGSIDYKDATQDLILDMASRELKQEGKHE